jgi:hypothetical protein
MWMRDTFVISGLRKKRARIAGEIEAYERRIAPLRETLAQLDAALLIFQPGADPELIRSIMPMRRCLQFRHGEQRRLCLAALRKGPATARQVCEHAMRAKGMDVDDAPLRRAITEQVRVALARLAVRGVARKVIDAPEVWWEVVQDQADWAQRALFDAC